KMVLNVDMGGGTTKFSLIEDGVVTQTAAINVGARLIAFDEKETITRIENACRIMMKELGHPVELGQRITDKMKEDFGAYMAKILFEVIEQGPTSPMAKQLMVTSPFVNYRGLDRIQHIVFSGGVSEHVYDRDPKAYGDIGPVLGKNMRDYLQRLPKDVLREPIEGIRATVIGAGEYTIQASGNTSYISNLKALPVHGLKVIQAAIRNGESPRDALKQALAKFDLPRFTSGLALSLSVNGVPDYQSVRRIAEGIAEVLSEADDPRCPLYLTLDLDVAKSLGGILKDEFKVARDVIAVDGIEVGDLDYIDIGEDLRTLPLGWWEERQCNSAFVQLVGQEGVTSARVTEIPPAKTLPPVKFALDEIIYVVEGRGLTTIWSGEKRPKKSFEWQKHSMFLIPHNYVHRLSNMQGDKPVRLLHY